MILAFRRPCADHRAALLDFVDRHERGEATDAALAHLDVCRSCEQELTGAALTIAALQRLHAEVRQVEPAPDAWPRLRARIARPTNPWRWRAMLGGLGTSAFLVAVLVLPITIGIPGTRDRALEQSESLAARRVETAYLASIRVGTLPPTPRAAPRGSVPQNYPPEIAQVRKEVPSAPRVVRSPEPI